MNERSQARRVGHAMTYRGPTQIWEAATAGIVCAECQKEIPVGERFIRDGVAVGGGISGSGSGLLPFCRNCRRIPEPEVLSSELDELMRTLPDELKLLCKEQFQGQRRRTAALLLAALRRSREELSGRRLEQLTGVSRATLTKTASDLPELIESRWSYAAGSAGDMFYRYCSE